VFLEAKNDGGEVLIIIKDDGRGLNREQILAKAKRQGLLKKPEQDLTEREIFNFILLPGFSTNEEVTEYSGRGVGMDVVVKSLEKVGGKILIDSVPDVGSTMTLKIPLTLAIIDGMTIKVGDSLYTVPTTSIRESFRMKPGDLITDPDGNEMILIRGNCYPIVRLHEAFKVKTAVTELTEGIIMMVENNDNAFCVFADELLGEQQVVVKALPKYVKKIKGIAGCTLLGNGEISLILDVGGLQ
jgi:two-component system chemotaxis sensor kinase CheA